MTYLEAVKLIKDFEYKYDVMSILYKGESVWPMLRVRILERITGDDIIRKSSGSSAIKQVLKTLFYYNPLLYFKRYKIWVFSHNGSRNVIGDKRVERTTGCVIDAEPSTLFIEKPDAHQVDYPRKSIPEKQIVSESWILMLVHIFATLFPLKFIKITNERLLIELLHDIKIQFDYRRAIRLLYAQKRTFDALLYICHKPKAVVIECPYTIMGYVWSLHKHGIWVVEMQHGVLNNHHYAYNSLCHSDLLNPDEMWVYGDEEYRYMNSEDCHYCHKVNKVGLYFLDYAREFFINDPFEVYRRQYTTICLVAGQTGYEDALSDYVKEVAKDNKDCLFLYVPRKTDVDLEFNADNVILKTGVNIYEYMIWCDIHLTISSTTCLECHYYHKPTIFYDFRKLASTYYGDILQKENGVVYTESSGSFKNALEQLKNTEMCFRDIFTNGTVQKMKDLLKMVDDE